MKCTKNNHVIARMKSCASGSDDVAIPLVQQSRFVFWDFSVIAYTLPPCLVRRQPWRGKGVSIIATCVCIGECAQIVLHLLNYSSLMRRIFISIVIISIVSCDYEPEGEFFVALSKPNSNGMSIELTGDTNDTLFVYGNAEIIYKSIIQNREVKYFQAFLNGQSIWTQVMASGSFFIYTPNYGNGCYSLQIEVNTFSGTGSLADKRGQETLRISKNYVLCIDNSKPDPLAITSIQRVDGTLELIWTKYTKPNFQKYTVTKYCYNQAFQYYEPHWIKEITSREINVLHDSSFIGGKVKYFISVMANNLESDLVQREFEDPYDLDITWEWVDNTNIKFTWRRTPYYKNFSAYTITFRFDDDDTREFEVNNVNDTTLTCDARLTFARTKLVNVVAYPFRVDTYHFDYIYDNTIFHLGTSFPWYAADVYEDKSVYNLPLNKYFAIQPSAGGYELIRIDPVTNEPEQAFAVVSGSEFLLSDNGQFLYVAKGDNFIRLDPENFSVIQNYNVSSICGTNSGYNWLSSLSGNNRLALTNAAGSFVLDMNTFSLVQQWPYDSKTIYISPTGKYLIRKGDILQWNATQYEQTGTIGTSKNQIFIDADNTLLLDKINTLEVINLNTLTINRTIILEQGYNLRYDPVSGLIGAITDPYSSGPRKFYLYNLNSNEKIKDFSIAGGIVLMNNSLITPGYILPLSFYYP